MENSFQTRACVAKALGSSYFLLLGAGYAVLEAVSWHFSLSDLALLLWFLLPMLVNRRWVHLFYGSLSLLVWGYVGVAILVKGSGSVMGLAVISGVGALSLVASILLIYAAVSVSEQRFSLI